MKNGQTKIITALWLATPLMALYSAYLFNHAGHLHPTGFIQYDNVSYIAYAKQYLDVDSLHLQYCNPFNDQEYAPIYFQPQTLFFALLLKCGISPGMILIPFALVCSIICFWLIISLYDHLVASKEYRTFNIWLFSWGGGLLAFAGIIAIFYLRPQGHFFNQIFILDPEHGWWGLNLGRSLIFTCEAYYHAVFLGTMLSVLRRRWITAFGLLLLLSLSHPFTGIELISIVLGWCCVEFFVNKKELPVWFFAAVIFAFCLHIYYYLIYLNQFPDHRSVSEQYTLTWRLRFYRMIPAYCIVGALSIATVFQADLRQFFGGRSNRLFICWFAIAFLLANHELFWKARQPIHFTRGYIWTSLFLLGLPALLKFNVYLKAKFKLGGLVFFMAVFLVDNFLWIANQVSSRANSVSAGYITSEVKEVLHLLNDKSGNKTTIVCHDNTIAYLSAIYTKAYPWYSHPYTTPFAEKKLAAQNNFFARGKIDSSWLRRLMIFTLYKSDSVAYQSLMTLPTRKILESDNYVVLQYTP